MSDTADFTYLLEAERFKKLKANVLIMWGENDTVIDIKYAHELNKYLENSKLYIIENSGHAPHTTDPEKVAELINNFIKN